MKPVSKHLFVGVSLLGLSALGFTVYENVRTYTYQDKSDLQQQEVPSWSPKGYKMFDTERRMAFRWTQDVDCPRNKKCLGLQVYTDVGCADQVIVHTKFLNKAGSQVDDTVQSSVSVRPQSSVTLMFVSDEPSGAQVEIIGVSCS